MTPGATGITVTDLGTIQSLEIPARWVAAPPSEEIGGRQLRKWHLLTRRDIRFCSYLRTVSLSKPGALAFQEVIYSEFHNVSQTELEKLDEILEGMSNTDAFQIIDANTGYLNSRRVLTVRGRWLKTLEETISCFVDVNGDGLHVHQIYFTAPNGEFEKYSETADQIFISIKWEQKS
jgi:hypothetical protein